MNPGSWFCFQSSSHRVEECNIWFTLSGDALALIGLVSVSNTAVRRMDEPSRVAERTDNRIGLASLGLTEVVTLEILSENRFDELIDEGISELR